MWPPKLLALFDAVDWESSEDSELYGPYNALLDFCFPWEQGWSIVQQQRPCTKGTDTDVSTVFVVTFQKVPTLVVEIKPARQVHSATSRKAANERMRTVLPGFLPAAQAPTLHGFSVFGAQLRHYVLNTSTGELTSCIDSADTQRSAGGDQAHAWSLDLFSQGGAQFGKVVHEVENMQNLLSGDCTT